MSAGSAVGVVSSTGLAVGDKVWLEGGGNPQGSVSNSITEAYITEVTDSTNIKLSQDYTPASTANSIGQTGFLTNTLQFLAAADSDTNKVGKNRKLAFKTEENTEQVNVFFQLRNTSSTVVHSLYFDNVYLSSNKFLQVSSQTPIEYYGVTLNAAFWDSTAIETEWNTALLEPGPGTPIATESKLLTFPTVTGPGTHGNVTAIKALQRCKIDVAVDNLSASGGYLVIYNSDGEYIQEQQGSTDWFGLSASVVLEKDDYIFLYRSAVSNQYGALALCATPMVSEAIILESQDEIFTSWTDYTPTGSWSTNTTYTGKWRRVGDEMEIQVKVATTGTCTDAVLSVDIPSGYTIDTNKLVETGSYGQQLGTLYIYDGPAGSTDFYGFPTYADTNSVYCNFLETAGTLNYPTKVLPINSSTGQPIGFATGDFVTVSFKVPIQGWNTNFNPLMSMPLVNIGSQTEYFYGIKDGTTSGSYGTSYGAVPYFSNEQKNTVNNLGTVTNTAALGTYFTASQRVKVTAAYYVYVNATNYFDCGWAKNLTATEANAAITSAPDAKRLVVNCGQYSSYNLTRSIACTILLEPGETLFPATDKESIAAGIGSISFLVERDNSHTNMAHIIKPAVAQARCELPQNTVGGQATSGSWQTRTVNKLEGESWYVSLDSNKLTFEPGTYEIQASAFFTNVGEVKIMLYDNTNSAVLKYGQNGYNSGAGADAAQRWVSGLFTFTESTDVYIKYWTSDYNATTDLGQPNNFTGVPEVYLNCIMRKLK